jgi:hypothetical protein
MGRAIRLISFDTTRTAQKEKELGADTNKSYFIIITSNGLLPSNDRRTYIYREQGDLISFLTTIRETYTDSKVIS